MNDNDAQSSYTKFHSHIAKSFETCFPIKKVKIGYLTKLPWLTASLKKSIKNKQNLYAIYLKHPSAKNKTTYKNYKNRLNHIIRNTERKFYQTQLKESQNNLRKSWMIIKEIINKKKPSHKNI